MSNWHNPKARFGLPRAGGFLPSLSAAPPLPVVEYSRIGKAAPIVEAPSSDGLPSAATVILTWADAEWAALHHVFCDGAVPMRYAQRTQDSWAGWSRYAVNVPAGAPAGWNFWGDYCLVHLGLEPVLLFKSNTHLDWPGAQYLQDLIALLTKEVQPRLILSVGTAGGTRPSDHIGTVRAVSAGTLYETGRPPADWPAYRNGWTAGGGLLSDPSFGELLFPVPTRTTDLETLSSQFNRNYGTSYTLADLDPDGLNRADPVPKIDDQTGGTISLLTAASFLVGSTNGSYQAYSCIEMDDAIVAEACADSGVSFGSIRNLSDPVQNVALPSHVEGQWASAIYDTYGFYTSYNGALGAWAILA